MVNISDINHTTALTGLVEFVTDAAVQDAFLAWDEIDRNDTRFTPIYAVDSNIVHMFVDPNHMAASGSQIKIGYGEVFHADSADRKAAINLALGQYIWYGLSPKLPLLLIPTVDREVAALLHAAAGQVRPASEVIRDIDSLAAQLNDTEGDTAKRAALDLARLLVDITRGTRLMELYNSLAFVSVDDLFSGGSRHGFTKDVLAALAPMHRIEDMVEYSNARKYWDEALRGVGRDDNKRLTRDVDAVAYVEFWNRRLVALENPHRLIYITGDTSILSAAAQKRIDDFAIDALGGGDTSTMSFLHAFIRHPRCFLDRPNVLHGGSDRKAAQQTTDSIRSWLGLLLGEYQNHNSDLGEWDWKKGRYNLHGQVKDDIVKVARQNPTLFEQMREGWAEFSRRVELSSLTAGHKFPPDTTDKNFRLNDLIRYLEKAKPELERELAKYWENCVLAFTEFRFLIDIINKRSEPFRRAPQLCLEGAAPERFIQVAKDWLRNPKSFDVKRFEDEKDRLRGTDRNDYNFLVATAFILASGQNWASAAFLCAHARLIARGEVERRGAALPDGPNGREAAYLEAFARRHSARTVSALDICNNLLDEAQETYKRELDTAKKRGLPTTEDAVPERFDAERLAIHFTRLMLCWNEDRNYTDIEGLRALSAKYVAFLNELHAKLSAVGALSDVRRRVLLVLQHRALVNVVSIGVFGSSDEALAGAARSHIGRLQELSSQNAKNEEFKSTYVEVVQLCGLALFGPENQRRRSAQLARALIDESLKNEHPDEFGFVYDKARYRLFREKLVAVR